jgi:hypothetical protein
LKDNYLLQVILALMWFFGIVIAEYRFGEGLMSFLLPPLAWYRLMEWVYIALTSSICTA